MSDLNLNQIRDKLNDEFRGEERTLIFWYDEKADFLEDVEALELDNVKIHQLTPTNLFKTKVLVERQDKTNNYLVYAPFKRPENRDNHLADTILYSKEFFADRPSLICLDMGIDKVHKPVIEKHINFFNAKDRMRRFYELEIDGRNKDNILIALMTAITKSKNVNFEEVLKIVLSEDLSDNKYLKEFSSYDLDKAFWDFCDQYFSYKDGDPSLVKLAMSLLLTYTKSQLLGDLPGNLDKYILDKPGTAMAFIDQMRNSLIYKDSFRKLSDEVYRHIDGHRIFKEYEVKDLINLDIFKDIDKNIISWILDRLIDENLNVEVNGLTIDRICSNRKFKHFKDVYSDKYNVLLNAYYLILNKNYEFEEDLLGLVKTYTDKYYKMDSYYRKFYYYLDRLESHIFEDLQSLVENIYVNRYLDPLSKKFIGQFNYEELRASYKLQKDFYNNFVKGKNERIIVIISDALRYEVAKDLYDRFSFNEKVKAEIEAQIGVLPSYTSLGMACLLPHKNIEITEDYRVYVDGKPTSNLIERNAILKAENPNSDSINHKDLKKMKKADMREFFAGKEVVYIYHDQIDERGDTLSTEDEVFIACDEAIEEIQDIIRRLTNNVSATSFIITADHGFIYTRSKNKEGDKIEKFSHKEDSVNKRYIISDNTYDVLGTKNILVADVLGGYDTRTITMPLTSNVFKFQGGGQNFVHGGSSPQEIIIPVIQVKTKTGAVEVENVKISLISMIPKITSLILSLDFVQQEAISDIIKPTTYRIKFVDKKGELISNEEIYTAKSKSAESSQRIFNLKFRLKDKKYKRDEEYYFTITDDELGLEVYRKRTMIDIAFAGDYGFNL